MKAIIYKGELDFIARCVMDYPDIETGGDLFGFWTHSGYPSIQYVIGPGPKSNRHATAFYQDKEYLIEIGRLLREKYALQHIGEWHSHHKLGLAEPSGGDKNTIYRAIEKYGLRNFFLTICNIESKDVKINGFYFSANKNDHDHSQWVILDNESPLRKEFDNNHKDLIYKPKEKKVDYIAQPSTTLEGVIVEQEKEIAKFPEGSWMNTKDGKEQLKNITEVLKKQFDDVKIFQTDDKKIKLEVDANNKNFVIIFPHDFPKSKPEIGFLHKRDGSILKQLYNDLNRTLTWKEDKYKIYITNYITALYSIDEIEDE